MKNIGFVLSIAVVLSASGCGLNAPKDLKSKDNKFQITVEAGMQPTTELNDEADIQAMNGFRELYVVVLTEPKSDFPEGYTIKEFAELALSHLAEGVGTVPGTLTPTTTTAGDEGFQADVHGTVDGIKIGYVAAFIEADGHFHQVLTWTLDEKFQDHRPIMERICKSLKKASPET